MRIFLLIFSFLILESVAEAGKYTGLIACELAFATLTDGDDSPIEKVPRSECQECDGTGRVKAGDGVTIVWRECTNCYDDSSGDAPECHCPNCGCGDKCTKDESCPCGNCQPGEEPKASLPTKKLLVFTATWCGPCKTVYNPDNPEGTTISELEKVGWKVGNGPENHIQMVDVDENPELFQRYGLTHVPSFVLIRNGELVSKEVGSRTASQVADWYNAN